MTFLNLDYSTGNRMTDEELMDELFETVEWVGDFDEWQDHPEYGEEDDEDAELETLGGPNSGRYPKGSSNNVPSGKKNQNVTYDEPFYRPASTYDDPDTTVAIADYVGGGGQYLNGALRARGIRERGGKPTGPFADIPIARTGLAQQRDIDSLDKQIQRNPLSKNTTLFRTIGNDALKGLEIGDVFQDDGYSSITKDAALLKRIRADIGIAEHLAEVRHSTLTILAPKGLGHLDVNKEFGEHHRYSHQLEVILPRGTRYKVVSKYPPDYGKSIPGRLTVEILV